MLPIAQAVKSMDIYRDGGSLSVTFAATDGFDYCLFFQIDWESAFNESTQSRIYQPSLDQFIRTMYVSPVTGVSSPIDTTENTSLSWDEARTLLASIQPCAIGFQYICSWVFPMMLKIAEQDGQLDKVTWAQMLSGVGATTRS